MPSPPEARPDKPLQDDTAMTRLQSLPSRTYGFRVLGMGLAALPQVVVMREIDAGWPSWAWMLFGCVVWPHLAYLLARRSRDPFRAERRNFMFDSVLAGSWLPMLHFNLLPSAVLLTVVTADKINSGIRNLWLWSLPGVAAAILVGGLLTGFQVDLPSSHAVVLACLPIMMVHTLAVSQSSYLLVRKVQRQNLQLAELSRRDMLTGLDSRGHWQAQADELLQRHHQGQGTATLLLVDVDRFKAINDRHGHGVGDDVLLAIAGLMSRHLHPEAAVGRLGGDEFAAVLPLDAAEAERQGEQLRAAVEQLAFDRVPGLRCSISLGLAEPPSPGLALREWLEAADRALYRAKHGGRNRIVGREPLPEGK
ncbi:diguanylate cyclase [Arenimonas sp. MALMAid1274]|uniref:diguanylate cyclase n=1 Tax=Arenimonas sp. MALMAid1274 TaxID=3411630 RepID=UPI003BA18103